MRAFIVFALFCSMTFAATLTKKGTQDIDSQYGDMGRMLSKTDTLRIGKNDIENPRHKMRDQSGELRHDANGEVREDTNQDGRADMRYYGYKWTMNLRAGKGM